MGTNTGTVMTIANSIVGVSVLAMPFCFKQCGIVLSIVMLILSSILTRLTCYLLLKSAVMSRRRNFEFLAFHMFGPTGKFLTELCIIGYLMGTCIGFFVIVGDLGPEIISESLEITNSPALRPSFMIGLAVLVILPLGLLRNIDSLSSICIATIGFYVCLVLKVFVEALPHLLSGIWLEKVHYWRPAGVLQCLPIFSGALFCQMTLFEIYDSLPNPSLERMNGAVHAAINMCTAFYISVGFLGYVAFCTQTFGGNILMSFLPSVMSDLIKFGFVLSLAVSFPLVIFPCRASLYSLLFRRIQTPHHDAAATYIPELRFKCITGAIIAASLAVGLVVPNIELVLGLVGSTIGVAICVMFPALAFICASAKATADRVTAQCLLGVGVLILVLGTYATLKAQSQAPPPVRFELPRGAGLEGAVRAVAQAPPPVRFELPRGAGLDGAARAVDKAPPPASFELPRGAGLEGAGLGEAVVVAARREPPVPQESVPAGKRDQPVEKVEKVEMPKSNEVIHVDALKKEDEELADAEKRDIGESHQKNVEVLRKIEQNKEEQERLLQEQKKIILNFQKERAKDEVSALKRKDLEGENEVEKAVVVKPVEPDARLDEKPVGKPGLEAGRVKAEGEGVIAKPAGPGVGGAGNSKDVKLAEDKVVAAPQPFAYQEQLVKNVAAMPRPAKPYETNAVPLRNMTIKSIIMPDFANKIPIVRPKQNSNDIAAKKTNDGPNNSKEREMKLEVDKIVSADFLKNNVVDSLDDGKPNQRDILSADEEKHEREKREAALAGSSAETKELFVLEAAQGEGKVVEEVAEDCPKADGVILQNELESDVDKSEVVSKDDPVRGDVKLLPSGGAVLIKVGERLTAPHLVADKVVVDALVPEAQELVDGAKPMTRDLKSIVPQFDGKKNMTSSLGNDEDLNEKIEI